MLSAALEYNTILDWSREGGEVEDRDWCKREDIFSLDFGVGER